MRVVEGDATAPDEGVIVHVVNDRGGWGRGFVTAVSARWPEPEHRYRAWARGGEDFELGRVQYVRVGPRLFVANVLAQHGYGRRGGRPPIRYQALETGLVDVSRFCAARGLDAHMPRIGCGLAGGTWEEVGPIVERTLVAAGVPVTVYDLPQRAPVVSLGAVRGTAGSLEYRVGDATEPVGPRVVVTHLVSDRSSWGRGFTAALSRRWPKAERVYREWVRLGARLGQVRVVEVAEGRWVAHVVGLHGTRRVRGVPPIRYEAIVEGFRVLADRCQALGASVAMPRIGVGQAGGEWERIEPIIQQTLCEAGVTVRIYDLASAPRPATARRRAATVLGAGVRGDGPPVEVQVVEAPELDEPVLAEIGGDVIAVGETRAVLFDGAWRELPCPAVLHSRQVCALGDEVLLTGTHHRQSLAFRLESRRRSWIAAPAPSSAVPGAAMVALPDGRALRAGGSYGESGGAVVTEVFDGTSWVEGAPLGIGRARFQLVVLRSGQVLAADGDVWSPERGQLDIRTPELWNGSRWRKLRRLPVQAGSCAPLGARGWVCPRFRVAAGGGWTEFELPPPVDGSTLPTADGRAVVLHDRVWLLDGDGRGWTPWGELPFEVVHAAVLGGGQVLALGREACAVVTVRLEATPPDRTLDRVGSARRFVQVLAERGLVDRVVEGPSLAEIADHLASRRRPRERTVDVVRCLERSGVRLTGERRDIERLVRRW